MRVLLSLLLGAGLMAFLWTEGHRAPHSSDGFTHAYGVGQLQDAVAAARGQPLVNGRTFADNCGVIFDETNHPTGDLYGVMLAAGLGLAPQTAIVGGIALMAGLFVAAVAWRSAWSASLMLAAVAAAVWGYPSFHAFLALPSEGAWATGSLFLIAAAALAPRPTIPMAIAVAVAAMSSIAFVTIYAGLVAACLIAVHGVSAATWRAGAVAIAAFIGVNAARLAQTWCYAGWDWATVQDLVFTGTGYGSTGTMATSVMFRVSTMSLLERWGELWHWFPTYVQAALSPAWSTPTMWLALMGICALQPVTVRSAVGAGIYWAGFLGLWILAPAAVGEVHLHLLPRLIVLLPIGTLLVLAVGAAAPPQMATSPQLPTLNRGPFR